MESITIRNLDDEVKTRLRARAAPRNPVKFTRECFAPLGGVDREFSHAGCNARIARLSLIHPECM